MRRAGKETAVNRWITTLVVGMTLVTLLPRSATAATTLPDIQSAFEPAYHLELRTTTSGNGVVTGVNLGLGLTPPAITSGTDALPVALDVAFGDTLGRHDGRSHPRRSPRRPPGPSPHFHVGAWAPIALVLALVIVITCPTFVVLYY